MAFRDENEALRARVQVLEGEVEDLRDELEDERSKPEPEPEPEPEAPPARPGDDLASLVAAREAAERAARDESLSAEERKRAKLAVRYAKRPPRVRAVETPGRVRVYVAPKLMRDAMFEEAGLRYGFFLINPGFVFAGGLAVLFAEVAGMGLNGVILGVVTWIAMLIGGNALWSWFFMRKRYTIELTDDGHFAVYRGRSTKPVLLGRERDLEVQADEVDPADLGSTRIGDGRTQIIIDKLAPRDLEIIRRSLPIR